MAYRVRGIKHLAEKIVPFFTKHSLKTEKNVDFEKFRRVIFEMEREKHLTKAGVEEIRLIASQMNRGRLR
jgi:hypothetical protein